MRCDECKITTLHFEAYSVISYKLNQQKMPADVLRQYERIYELTKDYKMPGMVSPSIHQMIENGQLMQLGSGDERT